MLTDWIASGPRDPARRQTRHMKLTQHLADFVVRITDLAEAEGRVLHRVLETAWVRVWLMIVAGLALVGGGAMLIVGVWLAISRAIGPDWGPTWASLITGTIAVVAGVIALLVAKSHGRKPRGD